MDVILDICISEANLNAIPNEKNVILIKTKFCCRPTMNYDLGSGQLILGDDGYYLEYYSVNMVKCKLLSVDLDENNVYKDGELITYTIGAPSFSFNFNFIQKPEKCNTTL
jgi:hypothetical protein